MIKILELRLHGDCYLCDAEDQAVWALIDKHEKGHLLCKACIETLADWGLIEQPKFELQDEE